ncbi:mandelate racemase/muconate lactonizing enzyme family protein [Rhizomonospora bruguierae]|uniref:mandelate racemase/muconate lactonizing enzyme family protein n=1 Tax=Rhizomonospora bruguierae TaxID=1581705 RepID=UPI001BCB1568|nr:mandelate racemase/muconate lactonizing enzyme family protein [Micromonospora sp. NBRC 107566]
MSGGPRTIPTVERLEVWPLEHRLGDRAFGGSRRLASARTSTLVKLTTSEGAVGWGEAFGSPRVNAAHLADLADRVLGQPIDRTEHPLLSYLTSGYHLTNGGTHIAALSAIDIAMWDAWARTLGVSVASLLGGRLRDTVPGYASTGYFRPGGGLEEFRREIHEAVEDGFTAIKIKVGGSLADDLARAAITRDALGPSGTLMVDYNANYPVHLAKSSIQRLRHLDLHFVEEPVPPDNLAGYRALQHLDVPMAGGEAVHTRFGFREVIATRAIDVIQPDVTLCGGFTEARLVCQMAQAWDLSLALHCWGGGLSQASTLQLIASLPTWPYGDFGAPEHVLECDRSENPLRTDMLTTPIQITKGRVTIPAGPGLGVEVDEDVMRRYLVDGRTHVHSR